METRQFILATAGHVDHGKSALVKALTGIDPDRLPEEKARGITIDLGFAHLELPAPPPVEPATCNLQPATFHLGIVDVPGHEDFVKNMVAGVGSVDLALFVVAADDGWMPQSEEHLQILSYLGVRHAVVALTKIDLVEPGREPAVIAALRANLQGTPFAQARIVPTSVVSGRGLADLKSALASELAGTPSPRDFGKPRLPIDRVFTLRGIGTVVTGTLTGGALQRGQSVVIQPSGRAVRIRSVQSHNREVEISGPGTRTALNLPDAGADAVARGDVVTLPSLGAASDCLDVLLEKAARLAGTKALAERPLKDRTRVRVHHGSGNYGASVHFLSSVRLLAPGDQALARLRLDGAVFAFAGDRFIVRDWSEQATLAGGIVLDPMAGGRRFRSQVCANFLQSRAESPDQVEAFVASQLARDGAARRSDLLVQSCFSQAEVAGEVTQSVAQGRAIPAGEWVVAKDGWQRLQEQAAQAVDAEHRAHPERQGLALSELRAALAGALPAPELFDGLMRSLCETEFVQAGGAIRRRTHRPALPPHLQAAGAKLRALLTAKPWDPPSRKELATDSSAAAALRFLVQTGEAVELNDEVVLLAEHFTRAGEMIGGFLRQHGSATASELRQALGTSRRVIIPLLERLDREGLTRREGDRRVLRPKP
jgi:selenocysteine-specific elongation factor